ncbi:MAG: SAM-dependent methyltransferase, partial [Deltaproteobacteria bacterium]
MSYKINSTTDYHRKEIVTLGWELTVCNTLHDKDSPARKILQTNASYGEHLFAFLSQHINMSSIFRIFEVGGGYGFLMRDLLNHCSPQKITMLDISPFLLAKQQEALDDFNVNYIDNDFLACEDGVVADAELMIFNENLGDFPTITNVSRDDIMIGHNIEALAGAKRLTDAYALPLPTGSF